MWNLIVLIPDHCCFFYLPCISELLWVCYVAALKSRPYIHVMLLLFQSSGIVCNHFLNSYPMIPYRFDTVVKVDTTFAFALKFTLWMDYLINFMTGKNVAFILTVSPIFKQS